MTTRIFSSAGIASATYSIQEKKKGLLYSLFLFLFFAGNFYASQATAAAKQWPPYVMVAPGMEVSEAQQLLNTA